MRNPAGNSGGCHRPTAHFLKDRPRDDVKPLTPTPSRNRGQKGESKREAAVLTTVSESVQSGFGGGGREDRLRMNGQVIPLLSSIPPDRGIRGTERAIRPDFSIPATYLAGADKMRDLGGSRVF